MNRIPRHAGHRTRPIACRAIAFAALWMALLSATGCTTYQCMDPSPDGYLVATSDASPTTFDAMLSIEALRRDESVYASNGWNGWRVARAPGTRPVRGEQREVMLAVSSTGQPRIFTKTREYRDLFGIGGEKEYAATYRLRFEPADGGRTQISIRSEESFLVTGRHLRMGMCSNFYWAPSFSRVEPWRGADEQVMKSILTSARRCEEAARRGREAALIEAERPRQRRKRLAAMGPRWEVSPFALHDNTAPGN